MDIALRGHFRKFVQAVSEYFCSRGKHEYVGFFFSTISSILARRRIRVEFDGQDWVHQWSNGSFFHAIPVFFPKNHLNSNLYIFARHYFPKMGDVIIDIGAGAGTEIPFFSKAVGDEGKVFAIEPDLVAFRRLKKMIDLQKYRNVIPINLAIGSASGFGKMISKGDGDISGRVEILKNPMSSQRVIEIRTLDSIILEYSILRVNFLKINVEGHELEVLEGIKESKNQIENMCISCHDFLEVQVAPTQTRVMEWLSGNGFLLRRNPESHRRDFVGFYVYASRN